MADQHDGSIIVDTGIDTDGFEKGSEKLLRAIKSLTEQIDPLGNKLKTAFKGSEQLAKAAAAEVKGLSDSMSKLQKTNKTSSKSTPAGPDMEKAKSEADAYIGILDELAARQDQIYEDAQKRAAGGDSAGAIEVAKKAVETAREELKQLEGMLGGDKDALGKPDYNSVLGDIAAVRESYRVLEEQIRHVGTVQEQVARPPAPSTQSSTVKALAEDAEKAADSVAELNTEVKALGNSITDTTGPEPSGKVLDLQESKQEIASYKQEVNAVVKEVAKLGPALNRALSGDAKAADTLNGSLDSLLAKVADLSLRLDSAGRTTIPTERFAAVEQQIEKTIRTLNRYRQQEKRATETGASQNTQSWKNLQWEIQSTQAQLERLTATRNQMINSGSAYTTLSETSGFQALSGAVSDASGKLVAMSASMKDISSSAPSAGEAVKSAFSGIGKVLKLAGKKLKSFIGQIHKTKKASRGLGKHLKSIGFMLKQMLAFRALYAIFNGIKQGMQNLAQASTGANKDLSALKSSLTQLKNSLATAFAPILTVITPALVSFMNTLSRVITMIGQFIAALSGATSFTKAIAVQEDYAASLKGTGSAAEEAKKQLAGFDDLNVLSDNSSGGGGGVDPSEMFEEVTIDSPILDFANKLKTAFENGDYEGIGRIVGEKINSAISKVGSYISWDNAGGPITEVVTGIARTVNSLFDTIEWEAAGNTVAEGVNTLVNTMYLAFTGINWGLIGKSMADGLDGIIAKVEWAKLGQTIAEYFNISINFLVGFMQNLEWFEVGKAIGEALGSAISGIDWPALAQLLWEVVKGVIEGFGGFLAGLGPGMILAAIATVVALVAGKIAVTSLLAPLVSALGTALTTIIGGICTAIAGWPAVIIALVAAAIAALIIWLKNGGAEVVSGWFKGMGEALSNMYNWIKTEWVDPFIKWFKDLFGIHSPSKVMEEQGGFLVSGLYNGLANNWHKILSFLSGSLSDIRQSLSDAWAKVRTEASTAWGNVGTAIQEKLNGIKSQASTWGTHICENIANGIRKGIDKVRNAATNIASTIKSILGFSEPEKGPLSNFHTYMPDMLDLMEEGILANEYKAANAAAHVAQAISDEVQNGDYGTGKIIPDRQIDTALTNFSDKIADSFTSLLNRLQAIANGVTFTAPIAASGVVPYSVSASASGSDEHMGSLMTANNEALMALLARLFPEAVTEIVNAIRSASSNGPNGVDPNAMTSYVINEINRRSNMIGLTPIVR